MVEVSRPRGRPKGQAKKRLNLDLIANDWKRLEDICRWTDRNYSEVVRYLIRAWHDLGQELRKGGKLFVRREDGSEAVIVLHITEDRPRRLDLDFKCPSCGSDPDVDCHCKPGG